MTWTGADERYDLVGIGSSLMTAADVVAAGVSVNMNANFAAAPTAIAGAGAAFGPA